jgi:capsular polysaccharide biosynthesis protein
VDDRPPFILTEGLLRRYRVVLAITGVCLLVAAFLSVLLPKTYESTAIIYLDTARTATDFDSGIAAGDLLQHDFIVSATSRPTLQAACQSPGIACTTDEMVAPETTLGKKVTASVYRGTSELSVTAKGSTPEDAAALANAVAQAMIDQDAEEVIRLNQPARDNLNKELTQVAAEMNGEQKALSKSPAGSSAAAAHQAALTRLQNAYAQTLARLLDLNERQDRLTNVATIVQRALPPTRADSPNPLLYLGAALVAGLCVGIFTALLIERFDDRIFSPEALAKAASIPHAFVTEPQKRGLWSSGNDSYSLALAHLLARSPGARTVLVVASSRRDDSDPVAAGLGAAAAGAGQRADVVQFDPASVGSPRLARSAVAGMTTIRMPHGNGAATAAAVAEVSRIHDSGPSSDNLALVAVPSPDISPAAVMLGRASPQAALVATRGVTRFGEARRTAELLRQAGVDVAAGILVSR